MTNDAPLKPPTTYADWSELLNKLKRKECDADVLAALQNGTIVWQSGVAERFSQKLIDTINARMNAAIDKFQKDMGRTNGQEGAIVQALLSLRKEFEFLFQAINLPAIPEKDRTQYCDLVREQADKAQCSLEDSAKKDRTGKMASIVRNHKVNVFGSSLNAVSAEAEEPATVMRAPGTPLPVPEGMPLATAPARSRNKTYIIAAVASLVALLIIGGIVLTVLVLTSSKVTVPDVEGLDVDKAEEIVSEAGLSFKVAGEIPRDDVAEGEVLSQSPAAGQELEKGAVVEVDVAMTEEAPVVSDAGVEKAPAVSDAGVEKAKINEIINTLAIARNQNNLAMFMTCYSYNFRSTPQNNPSYRNLDFTGWQAAQAKYFSPPYTQNMTVESPNIMLAPDIQSADVTFGSSYQLYRGGDLNHADHGIYTLKLVKEADGWRIVSESWVAS